MGEKHFTLEGGEEAAKLHLKLRAEFLKKLEKAIKVVWEALNVEDLENESDDFLPICDAILNYYEN